MPEHPTPEGWREAALSNNWRLALATDWTVAVVQRIFAAVAGGKTLKRVATELNASQAPLPRGARAWTASRIRSIARNSMYVGDLVWSRRGAEGGTHTVSNWLPDPPVDREMFDPVQQRLQDRVLIRAAAPRSAGAVT